MLFRKDFKLVVPKEAICPPFHPATRACSFYADTSISAAVL